MIVQYLCSCNCYWILRTMPVFINAPRAMCDQAAMLPAGSVQVEMVESSITACGFLPGFIFWGSFVSLSGRCPWGSGRHRPMDAVELINGWPSVRISDSIEQPATKHMVTKSYSKMKKNKPKGIQFYCLLLELASKNLYTNCRLESKIRTSKIYIRAIQTSYCSNFMAALTRPSMIRAHFCSKSH